MLRLPRTGGRELLPFLSVAKQQQLQADTAFLRSSVQFLGLKANSLLIAAFRSTSVGYSRIPSKVHLLLASPSSIE
jgi:hypothetical protein